MLTLFDVTNMFTTYVLYSEKYNKIYVGYTSSLEERVKSHNIFAKTGYTVKFRPWIVIYTECYDSKQEAMKREKELKTLRGRDFIRNLIKAEKYLGTYPSADGHWFKFSQ